MALRVVYEDYPVGAQDAATVTSTEKQSFSSDAEVMSGVAGSAWATLEADGWPLNGTRRILTDAPAHVGWWSRSLSAADGTFATPPTVTISFPDPYTASGLTFAFDTAGGQYCASLEIRWYNGMVLLQERTYAPTSAHWLLHNRVQSFDRIELRLLAWSAPQQFAKIERLTIGVVSVFEKDELVSVTLTNEIDPSLSQLSVDAMTVKIVDRKGAQYDAQEGQKLVLYHNDTLTAVQYIESSEDDGRREYTFRCQSLIGLLEDEFLGGLYSGEPVGNLLDAILGKGLWKLDDSFSIATLTGYLPVCTRREALQQLCFAVGAIATTQGTDGVRLLPVPVAPSASIGKDRIFLTPAPSLRSSPRVRTVEVFVHSYTPSDEEETLIDDEIDGEDVLYTFDAPHHGYAITGGTLLASGVNWVRITASGQVKVSGKKYIHSTYRTTKINPEATASERNNTLTVDKATLVSRHNAAEVLQRVYDYSLLRKTLTESIVAQTEQAGQIAVSETLRDKGIQGYISSMVTTFTGTGRFADITIIGADVAAMIAQFWAGDLFAGEEALY